MSTYKMTCLCQGAKFLLHSWIKFWVKVWKNLNVKTENYTLSNDSNGHYFSFFFLYWQTYKVWNLSWVIREKNPPQDHIWADVVSVNSWSSTFISPEKTRHHIRHTEQCKQNYGCQYAISISSSPSKCFLLKILLLF